jgi:hypothetical protein
MIKQWLDNLSVGCKLYKQYTICVDSTPPNLNKLTMSLVKENQVVTI